MIPAMNIIAWGNVAPWAEQRQAEERMFAKLRNPGFLTDIRPLLAPAESERLTNETMKAAFVDVFMGFIAQLPGNPWARTGEMTERFELDLGATG